MKTAPLALVVLLAAATPALAQQEDVAGFFRGKTLRLIVGVGVGSGYDINARLLARHMAAHIPGQPVIIVQNQPGAGSLTMTNALYHTGPFDGTVMGASFNGMPTTPLLQPTGVRFDPVKFNWLGSTNRETQVMYVWHTAPAQVHLAQVPRVDRRRQGYSSTEGPSPWPRSNGLGTPPIRARPHGRGGAWSIYVSVQAETAACGFVRRPADDAIDQAIVAIDEFILTNSSLHPTRAMLEDFKRRAAESHLGSLRRQGLQKSCDARNVEHFSSLSPDQIQASTKALLALPREPVMNPCL